MAQFQCDNPDTEAILRRLCDLIAANGGTVSDAVTIVCEDGTLSLTATQGTGDEPVLVIPPECLIPLERFTLGLQNDQIVIKDHDPATPAPQLELMQTVIALFNATGKIHQHKKASVFGLHYHDTALLRAILACRDYEELLLYKRVTMQQPEEFFLFDFIYSRGIFSYKTGQGDKQAFFIAPLVDCINHHPLAQPVRPLDGQDLSGGVKVFYSSPPEDTQECFFNYGRFDAADTFLFQNFVDPDALFVRSVPLTIALPQTGTLRIHATLGRPDNLQIPDPFKDLDYFFPGFASDAVNKAVDLSFLCIPGPQKPGALRRMLLLAWNQITDDPKTLEQAVLESERQIIEANLRHYTERLDDLMHYETTPETQTIVQNACLMAQTQIDKIKAYPFFAEAMGSAPAQEAQQA